jgi:putative intracellular protease/amidase
VCHKELPILTLLNRVDLEGRVTLAVTAGALVLLAPLLLEHDDLLVFAVADDGRFSGIVAGR